jgi:hypothetical protein
VFRESVCGHVPSWSSRQSRSGRARYGGLTCLIQPRARSIWHRHCGGYLGSHCPGISRGARPGGGDGRKMVGAGVPFGASIVVQKIEDGRRRGRAEVDGRSSRCLRGELRLPRQCATCTIRPTSGHLGETLYGPHEGPLAPMAPPHARVIGGTVRVAPVGRGDPPQDDLIDRARGIVQRVPTVHGVENGRTAGNLRKRGPTRSTPVERRHWETEPKPDGPGALVIIQ